MNQRFPKVLAVALGVGSMAAPGACANAPDSLRVPSPSSSPNPSPSEPAPTPLAVMERFDHPNGLYSFSYPRGWYLEVHGGSESPAGVTVQNYPARTDPKLQPDEVKIDIDVTIVSEFEMPQPRTVEAVGIQGLYRFYAGDELGDAAEGSGVSLSGAGLFELRQDVGRFDGIALTLLSGTDTSEVRDLFLSIVKSLEVHQ